VQASRSTMEGHQALTHMAESPPTARTSARLGRPPKTHRHGGFALYGARGGHGRIESTGSFDEEAIMVSSSRTEARHPRSLCHHLHLRAGAAVPSTTLYQVTDRLHEERTVRVPFDAIGPTVSAWLAELGANSPMVEDLARAVRNGDWRAAYAVGEHLSVRVAVAA
jgi:hypothetical protein